MKHKIPTKEACEIADIHRARFNEAVAAGHYKHAPESSHGTPRMFGEKDLIALVDFSMRLHDGAPPRYAGAYSSLLRQALDHCEPDDVEVVIRVSGAGLREKFPGSKKVPMSLPFPGGAFVHREERVNLNALREYIRKHTEVDG